MKEKDGNLRSTPTKRSEFLPHKVGLAVLQKEWQECVPNMPNAIPIISVPPMLQVGLLEVMTHVPIQMKRAPILVLVV
jgi:hypothetical protein